MSIVRTLGISFLFLFIIALAFCEVFYHQLKSPLLTKPLILEVKPGEHKIDFSNRLYQLGFLSYPRVYATYLNLQADSIKRGEYLFQAGSSLYSMWLQVSKGKGFYYRAFTIVPGWNIAQLRSALVAAPALKQIAAHQDDAMWSKVLGLSTPPEGVFLPETYFYTKGTSDWVILKKAKHLMDVKLATLWAMRAQNVPFKSPYEALIAASLIEKEAYYHDERPMIAGVLVNRLNKNMLLQFDPSVIYGLKERYDGTLHAKDLKENTPYNTYINKGLPPTPIAFPSLQSIQAVLHPIAHQYFYFVLESEKRHRFSTTLKMHDAAVSAYRTQKEKQK